MGFLEAPFDADDAERNMENGFAAGAWLLPSCGGSEEGIVVDLTLVGFNWQEKLPARITH